MEKIPQETMDKIVNNWKNLKANKIDNIDDLLSDIRNCESDVAQNILISSALKMCESIGIKEMVMNG